MYKRASDWQARSDFDARRREREGPSLPDVLLDALKSGGRVDGLVVMRRRGHLVVDVSGHSCICPISLLHPDERRRPNELVGRVLALLVLEVKDERVTLGRHSEQARQKSRAKRGDGAKSKEAGVLDRQSDLRRRKMKREKFLRRRIGKVVRARVERREGERLHVSLGAGVSGFVRLGQSASGKILEVGSVLQCIVKAHYPRLDVFELTLQGEASGAADDVASDADSFGRFAGAWEKMHQ